MKVYLATDHAGFKLKEEIKNFLQSLEYEVFDFGAHSFNPDDDYPDFIKKLADKISQEPDSFGIIFGGSGQGEAIVANRFKNIRAVVFYGCLQGKQKDIEKKQLNIIESARMHNNANVLSIGARFVHKKEAEEAVKLFLKTQFTKEQRHIRRINKIDHVN